MATKPRRNHEAYAAWASSTNVKLQRLIKRQWRDRQNNNYRIIYDNKKRKNGNEKIGKKNKGGIMGYWQPVKY